MTYSVFSIRLQVFHEKDIVLLVPCNVPAVLPGGGQLLIFPLKVATQPCFASYWKVPLQLKGGGTQRIG